MTARGLTDPLTPEPHHDFAADYYARKQAGTDRVVRNTLLGG